MYKLVGTSRYITPLNHKLKALRSNFHRNSRKFDMAAAKYGVFFLNFTWSILYALVASYMFVEF